ncbi:ribosome maturation factor RimM [Aphanothece hegewaldii CCALA 016]|uniref:Ribosome maturation factor RimM n=1 Tax=Aphanothece hegewaldii CCALA 016 TaxID=2107694 RepID=A0A2T1LRB3_9CHRO|nr:ribosome maturation factor RimM [Aphanothece hegewaldii]PSF31168.1 ribosome maturation factor RimM [Aphanothece hegewaldii CCALA 016]
MTSIDDLLEIGTIAAPQGLKGDVKVSSISDFPERFEKSGKRWLQSPKGESPQEIMLIKGRYIPSKENVYIIQLAGIESREQAENLRGYKLFVQKSDRPILNTDEYHVSDLINLEVYNQINNENIGIVTNVFWAGNDILEVRLHQQPIPKEEKQIDFSKISRISKRHKVKQKTQKIATVLIPFVKEIVPVINLDEKRIEINPPLGLLDINLSSDRETSSNDND